MFECACAHPPTKEINSERDGNDPLLILVQRQKRRQILDGPQRTDSNTCFNLPISFCFIVEGRTDEVQTLYRQYLAQTADPAGLQHFTQELAAGMSYEILAVEILGSQEYFDLPG